MPPPPRILVATEPVDFRKPIGRLAAPVELRLREAPLSGTQFVFTNRSRDALKRLDWDQVGILFLYKRLDKGRFRLPVGDAGVDCLTLTYEDIIAVLAGIDLQIGERLYRWSPSSPPCVSL
jgi:transposase